MDKATDAAIKYFKEAYAMFNNWTLAAPLIMPASVPYRAIWIFNKKIIITTSI